jgi:hypothetical protein
LVGLAKKTGQAMVLSDDWQGDEEKRVKKLFRNAPSHHVRKKRDREKIKRKKILEDKRTDQEPILRS